MSYTIEVVKDTCRVLDTFLESKDPLSLAELTTRTGLTKNKVFRILMTLEECQLVERLGSSVYSLHVRFLEFGLHVSRGLNVVEVSAPVLEWLVTETDDSAFISIVDGKEALCVASRESENRIRMAAEVGRRLPLYAGATPTVLFAFMPEEKRQAILDEIQLVPLTSQTITDRDQLARHLERIRNQGYVVTPEDLTEGARGVAAPIRDFTGQVIASISVAGVASRFTEERVNRYVELILEASSQISRKLGYRYTVVS
jgi:IclR family transcriptional regulator, KDG regulon repressor